MADLIAMAALTQASEFLNKSKASGFRRVEIGLRAALSKTASCRRAVSACIYPDKMQIIIL